MDEFHDIFEEIAKVWPGKDITDIQEIISNLLTMVRSIEPLDFDLLRKLYSSTKVFFFFNIFKITSVSTLYYLK